MSKKKYDGYELDYFDNAYNFRKYQLKLIKKYLLQNLVEVGPGKGGLIDYYKKYTKKIYLIEPERKFYKIFSLSLKNLNYKLKFWNLLIPIYKIIDFVTFNQFGKSLLCVYRNDKK